MPDGVEGYLEVGNTAYITFDAFTFSRERLSGYNENSADISDTVGLIVYAHSQINRENSPIENVVLDLSCNQGGETDIAVYVTAWMLGYCDFHATNPITGSYATTSYKVDVNLDGIFDENDTVANKNLYCLISNASFSGANLVPALLKESGRVTLLGATSGGGGCSVQFASMADGTVFQFSSNHYISVVSNGAYYGIDRGVEPHYYFGKYESYFDREALTEYINGLK
jgi:C-terminal processing protease CtpA/Prc